MTGKQGFGVGVDFVPKPKSCYFYEVVLRMFDMENSLTQYWKNPTTRRYYRVQIAPDLFGELCLVRSWGSMDTARGNSKMELLRSWQEAQQHLSKISKERTRKGYQAVVG